MYFESEEVAFYNYALMSQMVEKPNTSVHSPHLTVHCRYVHCMYSTYYPPPHNFGSCILNGDIGEIT